MKKIPLEISARHIHLTRDDVEQLFGENHQLKILKKLSQPGMFAAEEIVTVVSLKDSNKKIEKVRVVGPEREHTQLEVSFTDARKISEVPPIRTSGNVKDTPGFKIIGPKGDLIKENGLIAARRHIHMTQEQAEKFNVKNEEIVKISAGEKGKRRLIFDDVKIRVHETYDLACHIDTDEGNAAGLQTCGYAEIINQ